MIINDHQLREESDLVFPGNSDKRHFSIFSTDGSSRKDDPPIIHHFSGTATPALRLILWKFHPNKARKTRRPLKSGHIFLGGSLMPKK